MERKIFVFDINNSKNDFARAFNFIDKVESSNFIMENIDDWESKHISVLQDVFFISNVFNRITNVTKRIIAECEEFYFDRININDFCSCALSENDYFYFRVLNGSENDIVNLHYYYLRCNTLQHKCAMGIITNDLIMERMAASFLINVKENFSENYIKYQIVDYKQKSTKGVEKCKYKIMLVPSENERVFFLRKREKGASLFPYEIDDKGISVSKRFFPLLNIGDPNVYLTLSSSAYDIFGDSLFIKGNRNKYIYNDLLYNLVSKNYSINWDRFDVIDKLAKERAVLLLKRSNFLEDILTAFAKSSYINICKGESSSNKEYIQNYIKEISLETSALAICIFLSFWSFMKETGNSDINKDALLMDSEDYADGLLQIIENATKHAKNGYFCFRIHIADLTSKTDSSQYLKKYNLDLSNNKYYLEALVSDYNNLYDIPTKLINNIITDYEKPEEQREYVVSRELLNKLYDNFTLTDLFNYDNNQNTKNLWNEFYSESKNLVSHYGLLVFERIVNFAKGAFYVTSDKCSNASATSIYKNVGVVSGNISENYEYHIPGTQYEILLPIGISHSVEDTGFNYVLNTNDAMKPWKNLWVDNQLFNELHNTKLVNIDYYKKLLRPYFKIKAVTQCSKKVIQYINSRLEMINEYTVLCFDVKKIDTPVTAEIFSKIFINLVYNERLNDIRYFAIKNASNLFMNSFIRMFSLLYFKTGQKNIMLDRQVYICSRYANKEIVFYSNSIVKSMNASKNIAIWGKGEPTQEFRFLERQAEKAQEIVPKAENNISILPFDVIVEGVFSEKVVNDLKKDIQKDEFGCCLKEVHMRVGTKIHIFGNYYEASLLFSNSNYVSRFAFLIFEKVVNQIDKILREDIERKIVLIGYESYSESLIISLKKIIENKFCKNTKNIIDYLIYYENKRNQPFSRWEEVAPNKSTRFIIIVPIGSTLTTHEKIVADLFRKIELKEDENNQLIMAHFAVVLIRNSNNTKVNKNNCRDIECNFWENIIVDSQKGENYVIYKNDAIGANKKISFLVSVESEWRLPNECEYCFPKDNINKEQPLIQANRSSVVPMIMYGLSTSKSSNNSVLSYEDDENKLAPLKDGLCYGHYLRGKDNHYQYYFKTDKVMDTILKSQSDNFQKWLNKIKYLSEKSSFGKVVFNFIVAPLHKTNAQFVHSVNSAINAKQIIWLDTKKEYRDNVKAKYSNLTALVKNMIKSNFSEEVHLHFHFVDDTITSGFTINRSRSLLKSLFYDIDGLGRNIHLHIFSSVILLLNRCSLSSMKDYVSKGRFMSYINLNISVMRSHSDACVPCKNYKEYNCDLRDGSSTNSLSKLSVDIASKYKLIDEAEINAKKIYGKETAQKNTIELNIDDILGKDYGFYLLIATHRFNTIFQHLMGEKNNSSIIEVSIWSELNNICEKFKNNKISFEIAYKRLFSALYVLSRPFLSYRHSTLKAITKILLNIFGYFMLNDHSALNGNGNNKYIIEFLEEIRKNDIAQHKAFLMLLIYSLSSVSSTVLIRPFVINQFFEYCNNNAFNDNSLYDEYAIRIKYLLSISGKENLSVWLECAIKRNNSKLPNTITNKDVFDLSNKNENSFIQLLLFENVYPIRSALDECVKAYKVRKNMPMLSVVNSTLKQYYCKNYCDLVSIDAKSDKKEYEKHCEEVFLPMFEIYWYLINEENLKEENLKEENLKEENYYTHLLYLIEPILNANKVLLLIETAGVLRRLYPKTNYSNLLSEEDVILEKFVQNIKNNNQDIENIGDTLFWDNSHEKGIGTIKMVNNIRTNQSNNIPVWYIAFSYDKSKYDKGEYDKNYSFITAVRNLLVMRFAILKHLTVDFDNNIIVDFLNFKSMFQKLGTDKSGSHTPYEELEDDFYDLMDTMQNYNIVPSDEKIFANQYKLISDSLISKWYVHAQMKTFPEMMKPTRIMLDYSVPLEQFSKILLLVRKASVNVKGTTIYCEEYDNWNNLPWKSISIMAPQNCSYMWCCAFHALVFNALNHGYYEFKNGKNVVIVDLKYDNTEESFIISNRMKEGEIIASNSVTLTALTYFFDSYYGEKTFSYEMKVKDGITYFVITLPCINKENKKC